MKTPAIVVYKISLNKSKYVVSTKFCTVLLTYSSVPNRRVGRNKRAGGKILRKH